MIDALAGWLLPLGIGYLAGSLSGTRLVARLAARRDHRVGGSSADPFAPAVIADRDGSPRWELGGVGPHLLRGRVGTGWWLLAIGLDMAKGALPVAVLGALFPADPDRAIALAAVVAGDVLPVFHRFSGGFGIAALSGALLAVDPIALVVLFPLGILVGRYLLDDASGPAGIALLLPSWFIVVEGELPLAAASIVAVVAVLVARHVRLAWVGEEEDAEDGEGIAGARSPDPA
ncbi:MAG: Glycerol-3-phosphate acyltransferase [Chloroflexota bacterium]|jgi:glycerol-3-phosphate acyltransferase PlsY